MAIKIQYDDLCKREEELIKAYDQAEDKSEFLFSKEFEEYCSSISSFESSAFESTESFSKHLDVLKELLGVGETNVLEKELGTSELRSQVAERVVWDVIPTLASQVADKTDINSLIKTRNFIQHLVCSKLSPKELFALAMQQIAILIEECELASEVTVENEARLEWFGFWLALINEFGLPKIKTVPTKFYQSLILGVHEWFNQLRACQIGLGLYQQPSTGLGQVLTQVLKLSDAASKQSINLGLQFMLEILGLSLQGQEYDFASCEFEKQNPRYRTPTSSPEFQSSSVWHGYQEISQMIQLLDPDLIICQQLLCKTVYEVVPEVLFSGILVHVFCSKQDFSLTPFVLTLKSSIPHSTLSLLCLFQLKGTASSKIDSIKLLPLWTNFVLNCSKEQLRFIAYNCLSHISSLIPPKERFPALAEIAQNYLDLLITSASEIPPGALAMVVRLVQEGLIKNGFIHLENMWPVFSSLFNFASYSPPTQGVLSEKSSEIVFFIISHSPLLAQLVAFYGLVINRIPNASFKVICLCSNHI
ncbi:hypothetical protein DSO57_1004991 [Entomophthora muscae]|uniref:Uncharacterized protein n=1 Tax=Entomophthora muscae TaxID=34485 RepID=A0ACC2SWZ0_9FUNG|nr:hypothetical protein DSO57_1004991 [Entomophthora muscae]